MKSHHSSIILSGAAAAALLLAGCAKENGLNQWKNRDGGCAELVLTDVNSGEMLSKAAIDGTGFPRDGRIGLFFFKDEAGAELYGDGVCSNVEYSYNQDKGKWTASPAIRVGSTPGYLYGYYPYNDADKDVKSIAVESSLDGDDAMYAAKQDPVTDQTAGNVSITMRHALARVSITVKDKGYSGAAKLSRIEFVGAKTAQSGTLNALDGSISATKSDVTLEVPEANQQITEAGTRYECLLVPSEVDVSAQDVTLRLTIDGQQKTVSLTGENAMKIVSGVKARLTLDLSDSGLSVADGGIQIDDWQTVVVGGHTVTVKFDEVVVPNDILTDIHIEGQSVIIKATSIQKSSLSCNVGDDVQCQRVKDNDIYTFTISDISSNVEAVLSYSIVTITVSSNSNGKAWIGDDESKTSGTFYSGQQVVIHAAPNDKFRLYRWNDNNRENSRTFTVVGDDDAEYSANFISADLIPGLFSVGDGRQVFFSKGNLWYGKLKGEDAAAFHLETKQYEITPPSPSAYDSTLISHFLWAEDASNSMRLKFDSNWLETDYYLFTNKDAITPSPDLTVDGQQGIWRALSGENITILQTITGEWEYLIDRKDKKGNALYKSLVTVCGHNHCFILLPDDWEWDAGTVGSGWQTEYNESTTVKWSTMEAFGAVCLPALGFREGFESSDYNTMFSYHDWVYYWASTTNLIYMNSTADCLRIDGMGNVMGFSASRGCACPIRLVMDYQSEPVRSAH